MTRLTGEVPAELTLFQDFELLLGQTGDAREFDPERSGFGSEQERRAAWFANRERLIDWAPSRPWAQERYEGDESVTDSDHTP
jgi:hypothetical protein